MKDIAVITLYSVMNYGAALQAFALTKVIEMKGYHCEILKYAGIKKKVTIAMKSKKVMKAICLFSKQVEHLKKYFRFHFFRVRNIPVSRKKYIQSNLINAENSYDVFISGSDQIWNFDITGKDTAYMLDFISENSHKIAYAASFGCEKIDKDCSEKARQYLSKYSVLIVRETSGKQILSKLGLSASVALDPTLLLERNEWEMLIKNRLIEEDYILVYTVASPKYLCNIASKEARRLKCKVVNLRLEPERGEKDAVLRIYDAGPSEFLNYILYASAIFTTSFHGLVFSTLFNKEVYFEADKSRNENVNRLTEFADSLGISTREIKGENLSKQNLERINWQKVNRIISEKREESIKRLISAIEIVG